MPRDRGDRAHLDRRAFRGHRRTVGLLQAFAAGQRSELQRRFEGDGVKTAGGQVVGDGQIDNRAITAARADDREIRGAGRAAFDHRAVETQRLAVAADAEDVGLAHRRRQLPVRNAQGFAAGVGQHHFDAGVVDGVEPDAQRVGFRQIRAGRAEIGFVEPLE